VHHQLATRWLGADIRHGWASCPITQIGCIRIMSQPAYPNAQPAALVAERLRLAAKDRHHEFWAADAYLLALAVAHEGRFVTFDRRVPLAAVPAAKPRHLTVVE
jgi:predicted nucleic acid-binding protein